jgi:hypothetical protein
MIENNEEEYILIWEAPKIEAPEFRLYYKEDGSVDFYTCEKPEGKYIVIDQQTYAEGRQDVKVVDGRVSRVRSHTMIQKLVKSDRGQMTSFDDISIVLPKNSDIKSSYWEVKTYEC